MLASYPEAFIKEKKNSFKSRRKNKEMQPLSLQKEKRKETHI